MLSDSGSENMRTKNNAFEIPKSSVQSNVPKVVVCIDNTAPATIINGYQAINSATLLRPTSNLPPFPAQTRTRPSAVRPQPPTSLLARAPEEVSARADEQPPRK